MAKHVTFFRMKVAPGKKDSLVATMSNAGEQARLASRGWAGSVLGARKDNPEEVWVAVTWDTSENYFKNAASPEQNKWYEQMRQHLAADPEWFDCDVLTESRA